MFAKSSARRDYHLVRADKDQTLCGLTVVPLIIDRPVNSTHLHLTTEPPKNTGLCPKCEEVDGSSVQVADAARQSFLDAGA